MILNIVYFDMENFIINLKNKFKLFFQHLHRYLSTAWLPITLIIIFVLQIHLFNLWLDLSPAHYILRRTIVTIAFGLLFFGPAIFLKKISKYLYLFVASMILAIILIAQLLYHSYSGGFLQSSAFLYAGEGLTVLDTVKTLLTYRLIFFIIGPLLVLASFFLDVKGKIIEKLLSKKDKIIIGASMIIMVVAGYSYLFLREYMESGNTIHLYQYNRLFDVNALVKKVGIINFSLGDIIFTSLGGKEASAEEINFAKSWIAEHTQNTKPAKNFGLAKGRNLIIVQVESLENTVINEKIGNQEITPHLNKLAKEGLYFSNYYAQIGPGTSADAEFSTLNSFYPLPDTVAFIKYAYNNFTALPTLLRKNGYHTYSMHGDVSSFWNRANIYPRLGYEKSFNEEEYTVTRNIGAYDLGDEDFFNQSIPKLQSLPQPFMATLITLTSHTPYKLPDDLNTFPMPSDNKFTTLQQNYIQSIHYTDQAIASFIDGLKQAGLYENSLIVIFGDHGSFTNIGTALKPKTIFADLQSTQVPLIILAPNTKLHGINQTPASHIDLYPTVANLLGISVSGTTMFGQDIINTKNPVATQRILVSGTIKSILTNKINYHAGAEGKFEDGICVELPDKKRLPIENCRALYDQQNSAVEASDLIIRNNLIRDASTTY